MRQTLRSVPVILAVLLLGVGCSDSGDPGVTGPTGDPPPTTPPPPGTSSFTGSWDTTDLDDVGTPSGRYVLTQDGGTLTGDAYWRWRGVLERIGPITGTIQSDGSFEWTAVMNDNGWEGTETVTGKFTGMSSLVSGDAMLSSAGTPIDWKWFAPDGSLREEGTTEIESPPIIIPAAGQGPVGEVGLWRGAVLFSSPGNCNTQGFAWTVGLEGGYGLWDGIVDDKDDVLGALSARILPAGEVVQISGNEDFLGSLEGTVVGFVSFFAIEGVLFDFHVEEGVLQGTYNGNTTTNQTSTTISGGFTLDRPGCKDNFGLHNTGLFTLTAQALTQP